MRIKKLFKTEKEYLEFAWSFVGLKPNEIWRDEDLKIMQPFFVFDKIRYKIENEEGSFEKYWTPEIQAGFEHYKKCKEEYADSLFEIRDSIKGFNLSELLNFFFLEDKWENTSCWDYDSHGNEIDENGDIVPPLPDFCKESLEISKGALENLSFPLVFIGWIDSGWDRSGDYRIAFSEFVSLKEFIG